LEAKTGQTALLTSVVARGPADRAPADMLVAQTPFPDADHLKPTGGQRPRSDVARAHLRDWAYADARDRVRGGDHLSELRDEES